MSDPTLLPRTKVTEQELARPPREWDGEEKDGADDPPHPHHHKRFGEEKLDKEKVEYLDRWNVVARLQCRLS